MIFCDICRKNPAVFFQRHSGKKLCRNCFLEDIISRVKLQVEKYSMITPGDIVAIGVSGGKDSYVLLHIMSEILSPSRVIGITIDEGIAGYSRTDVYDNVKAFCRELGIECVYVSMRDVLGYGVDDFMKKRASPNKGLGTATISACTYCGIARRRILNMYARELGATKVATGHNLDDEVQTYTINILRGDVMRLIQLHPLSKTYSTKLVKRIKPLRSIYEYETAFYAFTINYSFQEYECPYIESRPTLRVKIRDILNELEKSSPGIQLRLLEFLDSIISQIIETKPVTLSLCRLCGEPTSPRRTICKFCELIESIGSPQDRVLVHRQMPNNL